MNKAVYFDLDGTLIDSIPDVHLCLATALTSVGRNPLPVHRVKPLVGGGARTMVEQALMQTGDAGSNSQVEKVLAHYIAEYRKYPVRRTTIYPGGMALLDELYERAIRLAICTNKPRETTAPVIEILGLQKYFSLVCCGDEMVHQKPDGRHIRYMLETMKLAADQVVMVGDSHNDVRAAYEAGVRSITVTHGYDQNVLNHPNLDLVVDHLEQVPALLEKVWRW